MQILLWTLVLIVSLVALAKSADYFTQYSEKLGVAFGLSSFIIGATIIAIGTSLPELISSLFAVLTTDTTEFVVDTVVGSNIANALLILGVGAVLARTLVVKTTLIDVDLPFFFGSMGLLIFFGLDKHISPIEGVFLLIFFVIFLIYSTRNGSKEEKREDKAELKDLKHEFKERRRNIWKAVVVIVISGAALAASAKCMIDSVLILSDVLGISSSLLTITVVAFGTSLPEILTSIAAIRRGNHGIAIGNVFGSSTFNALFVLGIPALFGGLDIANITFVIGFPFLVLATFFAIFATLDDKIRFAEGAAMLFLYVVFIAKITGLI